MRKLQTIRSNDSRARHVLIVALIGVLALGGAGCKKHLDASLEEVDLGGGREIQLGFNDGRSLVGRIVEGQTVRYTRNDSLFAAQVAEVSDDWIELSDPVLYTALDDWSFLQQASEGSEQLEDREVFATETLELADVNRVSLILPDNRRLLTESIFWVAAATVLGFAGLSR